MLTTLSTFISLLYLSSPPSPSSPFYKRSPPFPPSPHYLCSAHHPLHLPLPLSLKLLPVHFLIVFLISISIFLRQFTSNKKNINQYFSSIIFLYFLKTKAIRSLYYYSSFYLIKSFELGFLNFFLNTKLPQRAYFLGLSFFRLSLFPPLAYTILVSLFFFFILGFVFVSFF